MISNNNPHAGGKELSVWVLTDGKVGDDVQCLAIAKLLAPSFEKRVVKPRAPFTWMMPWGGIDPRDGPDNEQSPIAPPYPDVVIASGRRAIPYALRVKTESNKRTLSVILKDPRVSTAKADFVWAPAHDQLTGPNVFTTLTSPHDLSSRLEAARQSPIEEIADLPKPMLGVILGGESGGAHYEKNTIAKLVQLITEAGRVFASIAITPSRRTPKDMFEEISSTVVHEHIFAWRGDGKNPYTDIIANASALVVTADSHNMMSEALAAGVGVYAFRPPGLARKLVWFIDQLESKGEVRNFDGQADIVTQAPVDATADIVAAIREKLKL